MTINPYCMESFHYAYVKKYGLSQPYNDLQVLYLIILSLVEVIFQHINSSTID